MSSSLLPQHIAPVDAHQAALTDRYLAGNVDVLMAYFLALRAELDPGLAQKYPTASGKAYPYGRCEEITATLFAVLCARLRQPKHAVEHLIRDFADQGGVVRTIWGVLREQYFQNALQFGGLYVDVSNDTVVVTKPKVEILPIDSCGLVPVRDLDHFMRTAHAYWGASVYANHIVPSLAPILPMITVSPGRLYPGLQSACDYMIALLSRDAFAQAEAWLRDGPTPPEEVVRLVLATVPADLQAKSQDGRGESIAACQTARAAGAHLDGAWRMTRVSDFLRTRAPAPPQAPTPAVARPKSILTGTIW
jgi:hypothetical protein